MIKLVNGRGQLGNALSNKISNFNTTKEDIYLYHTWNIDDKSKSNQIKEYNKFVSFVDNHKDKRIVFVSTSSQKNNWYNYYKHLSESYLLINNENSVIIRLPTLVGKGVFESFRDRDIGAYGQIELMLIEDAADVILEKCVTDSKIKNFHISGEKVSAKVVKELILFGKTSE